MRIDHVEAACIADLVVDDDRLAVKPKIHTLKAEEVQKTHGHGLGDINAGMAKGSAGFASQEGAGSEVVDEDAYAHAAFTGFEERGGHAIGLAAGMPDVELHVDRVSGGIDVTDDRGKGVVRRGEKDDFRA